MSITPINSVSPIDVVTNDLIDEEIRQRILAAQALSGEHQKVAEQDASVAVAQLHNQDLLAGDVAAQLDASALVASEFKDTTNNLARLNELAQRATSAELTDADRKNIQIEVDVIQAEIDRAAETARFIRAATTTAAASQQEVQQASDLAAANDSSPTTELIAQESNRSHDLILDHSRTSVLAQANQNSQAALKLIEEV